MEFTLSGVTNICLHLNNLEVHMFDGTHVE